MPVIIRRYIQSGLTTDELEELVSGTASTTMVATGCVDIEIEDEVAGVVDTLDEVMSDAGYTFDTETPPTRTGLTLRSPDGTTWTIQVSDLGVLTAV